MAKQDATEKLTLEEITDLEAVACRAEKDLEQDKHGVYGLLEAVHQHCPLDFKKLLGFDAFNFAHDINGCLACAEFPSGKLKNHFLPRCAKPEPADPDEWAPLDIK